MYHYYYQKHLKISDKSCCWLSFSSSLSLANESLSLLVTFPEKSCSLHKCHVQTCTGRLLFLIVCVCRKWLLAYKSTTENTYQGKGSHHSGEVGELRKQNTSFHFQPVKSFCSILSSKQDTEQHGAIQQETTVRISEMALQYKTESLAK